MDDHRLRRGLPQKIQDIIVGCLLGDAHASKYGKSLGNTRIEFKQGLIHAPYLFFISFQFLHWGFVTAFTPVPNAYYGWDWKAFINHYGLERWDYLCSIGSEIYPLYPLKGIKTVPAIIGSLLTPRALAYWIMDDGGYHASGMLLHTNSFTKADVLLLISVLDSNFGIKANLRAAGNNWIPSGLCTCCVFTCGSND